MQTIPLLGAVWHEYVRCVSYEVCWCTNTEYLYGVNNSDFLVLYVDYITESLA